MRGRKRQSALRPLLWVLGVVLVLLFALSAVDRLALGRAGEEKQQLEQAVKRAAVACYAAEGFYPPELAYLQEHYGLQINGERFVVSYDAPASNLMPDITVLEITS